MHEGVENDEVKCPNCGSRHFVRKGKSKDKQFQRLRCKSCRKNWSVECFRVNKQMQLPEIMNVIVEHPDGMFSINKVSINTVKGIKFIKNIDYLTAKVDSYQKVVELASKLAETIDPNTFKLDNYISETLRRQLKIIFPSRVAKSVEDLLEMLCKDAKWIK